MKNVFLLALLLVLSSNSWSGFRISAAFGFPQGTLTLEQDNVVDYFSGCRELGDYIREVVESGYYYGIRTLDVFPSSFSTTETTPSAELIFSETNVQELGVDEADIIKTDGEYMYIANAGFFSIVRGYPPAQMELLFEHELSGHAEGLFVVDDMALVISSDWSWQDSFQGFSPITNRMTKLELFDITDRSAPILMREIYFSGSFNTARRIGDALHLVIESQIYDLYTRLPDPVFKTSEGAVSALFSLAGPADIHVDGLLPQMTDRILVNGNVTSQTRNMAKCDEFIVPPRTEGGNMMTILTLDLAKPLGELESTSILTDYATVYASLDRLYVAAMTSSFWGSVNSNNVRTRIHRFSLGAKAELEAIGEVPGTIVNRYSLGEQNGFLRVATTLETFGIAGLDRINTLYVLGKSGNKLEVVGELSGLGHEDEQIYAVRFDQDRGYVVTFRQTDPLYTLDLSDPTNPQAIGELEVPGFSTYLHPVGENHLLGIGRDPAQGSTDISLYDVTDFANPLLVDRVSLGKNSWSEALYEPKAFVYFAPANLLTIPLHTTIEVINVLGESSSALFNGAIVLKVDLEQGFEYQGVVSHQNVAKEKGDYTSSIRRSIFVGANQEYVLYTLSDLALKASDTNDLSEDLAVQLLPKLEQPVVMQPL